MAGSCAGSGREAGRASSEDDELEEMDDDSDVSVQLATAGVSSKPMSSGSFFLVIRMISLSDLPLRLKPRACTIVIVKRNEVRGLRERRQVTR